MGGQGIDMLVPTLLELGTEEQKQKYIRPTLMEKLYGARDIQNPMQEVILQVFKPKEN
jgi:alkylation response protein AidB-like acyl-CoA dehydrogenase